MKSHQVGSLGLLGVWFPSPMLPVAPEPPKTAKSHHIGPLGLLGPCFQSPVLSWFSPTYTESPEPPKTIKSHQIGSLGLRGGVISKSPVLPVAFLRPTESSGPDFTLWRFNLSRSLRIPSNRIPRTPRGRISSSGASGALPKASETVKSDPYNSSGPDFNLWCFRRLSPVYRLSRTLRKPSNRSPILGAGFQSLVLPVPFANLQTFPEVPKTIKSDP